MRSPLLGLVTVLALSCAFWLPASRLRAEDGVEDWPLPQVPEPSGVVYHPVRKSLFVVGDEGDIAEVSLDGGLLASRRLGGDLEGITCDTTSGALYVVREGVDAIIEVRPTDLRVVRELSIDRSYGANKDFLRSGGDGVEGIAFRPGSPGESSGTFFVVNQYDPPVLAELEITGERMVIRNTWKVAAAPLSDVAWDDSLQAFVVVSALWRTATVVSATGQSLRSTKLPGFLQEALTRLPDGSFIIAQDVGGLLKWRPSLDPFAAPEGRGDGDPHRGVDAQSKEE